MDDQFPFPYVPPSAEELALLRRRLNESRPPVPTGSVECAGGCGKRVSKNAEAGRCKNCAQEKRLEDLGVVLPGKLILV
jgi:hypothetical protein